MGACTACPANSGSPLAATSLAQCVCDEGYYDELVASADVSCVACPVGAECTESGATIETLHLSPGYWRVSTLSASPLLCDDADDLNQTACVGGSGAGERLCKPWTSGPYCTLCNVTDGSRYYDDDSSACLECGDGGTAATYALSAALVAAALAVLALLSSLRRRVRHSRTLRLLRHVARDVRAKVKQMIAFYQIATKVPDVFQVTMPSSVTQLLSVLDVFSLDVAGLGLPLGCLGLGTFQNALYLNIVAPIVLMLLIWAGHALAACRTRGGGSGGGTFAAGLIASLPANIVVLFFAFPTVSSLAFQAFSCEDFDDGSSYLSADYSVDCNDEAQYAPVRRLASVAIALYPVGVPLLSLGLLLRARTAILTEHPTPLSRALSFLHQDMEPRFFWWEIVEIGKKLLLVGFFTLIVPGTIVQLIAAFVFCLALQLFSSISAPYLKSDDDYFSLLCNFSLVAFFFFSLVLKMSVLIEEVEHVLSDDFKEQYAYNSGSLSVALVATLGAAFLGALIMSVHNFRAAAAAQAREDAAAREAEEARGRMSSPPTTKWVLPDGFKYCTFLSHFKVEAGSDARYLSDLIRRMTGQPAYLDSTDLVDLRTLFNEGVHKTDVLVILATKGVFTRPWCLMEMWEAATHQVPIVLFPVVGGGFELADAVHLLSDLATRMPARNPTCLAEVMEHVEKYYGVNDVREVEDVLLAHIGLVPSLERRGRPAAGAAADAVDAAAAAPSAAGAALSPPQEVQREASRGVVHVVHAVVKIGRRTSRTARVLCNDEGSRTDDEYGAWLDAKLARHLRRDVAGLGAWLEEKHATTVKRLEYLSWHSWGTDNQIIATVQTLMEACAAERGREALEWEEATPARHSMSIDEEDSPEDSVEGGGASGGGAPLALALTPKTMLGRLFRRWRGGGRGGAEKPAAAEGQLLLVCAVEECGGPVRLMQQEFASQLGCVVTLGSESRDAWRQQVAAATRGVVLLQTKSVLRHPVRLLQLFEAVQLGHPLVCVNVVGGGYDFAAVKPFLAALSSELHEHEMSALRSELKSSSSGPAGPGQLAASLSTEVPSAISVFFNPAAGHSIADAAIRDILDKLGRTDELHKRGSIQVAVKTASTTERA